MKKPSSATSSGNSISPCVHVQQCQSIIVIVIPFSNLNRVFAMGILFRLVIGLVDTTSMGIPTLSLQVNQILAFDKYLGRLTQSRWRAGHGDASMPCCDQRAGDSISSGDINFSTPFLNNLRELHELLLVADLE